MKTDGRRHTDKDRSAFFFHGAFDPAELANFNVQNRFLKDGSVFEVLGHSFGIWWGAEAASEFEGKLEDTRDWFETIAAALYLVGGKAIGVRMTGWVEALDVEVKEAVLGFADDRLRIVSAPKEDDPKNVPLQEAITVAERLRGVRHLHPAVKEIWRSGLDPSAEGFLSAFRALECVRRLYGEGEDADELKAAWAAMQSDLQTDREPFDVLREAAIAVRHGDRPVNRRAAHPVNTARDRHEELLGYASSTITSALKRHLDASSQINGRQEP